MTDARVNVGFQGPDSSLRLVYVREDNLLPSELERANATATNIGAGCGTSPIPPKTDAEANAEAEALHHRDQHAWPVRRLRLYPPVNAMCRCSYGTLRLLHTVRETVRETIVFSGSDQATLQSAGDPSEIRALGRVYDAAGNEITVPQLTYRGAGLVTAQQPIYGQFTAVYETEYRVVELTVVPTGESFSVQVLAYDGGQAASAIVPFDVIEFETGQVAGVPCGGGGGTGNEPVPVPVPTPRYQVIAMNHPDKVKKDEVFSISLTLRNINRAEGSGAVLFEFWYHDKDAVVAFTCPADGTVTVQLNFSWPRAGHYITRGMVTSDFFSQVTGSIEVTDDTAEEPEVWNEVARVMSDVDVDGVAIKRIEDVTMERADGSRVKMVFNNTGVS